jgi:hypothetical protein
MIVRLMGEGQFRVPDEIHATLEEIDREAEDAVKGGHEDRLAEILERMHRVVREAGEELADDDLTPSDLIVPPVDLSMDEADELFAGEGLIPDLPVG